MILILFEVVGKNRTGCGGSQRRPVGWQWWMLRDSQTIVPQLQAPSRWDSFPLGQEDSLPWPNSMNILLAAFEVCFPPRAVTELAQGGCCEFRSTGQQWDASRGNEKKSTTKEVQKVQVYLRFTGFCSVLSCYSSHKAGLHNSNTFSPGFFCCTKQGWFNLKNPQNPAKPHQKSKRNKQTKNPSTTNQKNPKSSKYYMLSLQINPQTTKYTPKPTCLFYIQVS